MLRLYDNVPRYAQAQTIMGNRLMYGNYIDGYNITNSAGQSVYLDYTLERVSESLGAGEKDSVNTAFTYTINGAVNQLNATASYDTTGFALITGSQIGISFNFGHGQFSGSATYIDGNEPLNEFVGTFLFTLQQNFDNAHDMVTSQAFIDGITTFVAPSSSNCFPIKCSSGCTNGSSVTDLINCGIVTNAAGGWEKVGFGLSGIDQGIVITSTPGSNVFTLTPQALKFEAYNQATVPPTALGVFAFEYLTIRQSELLYSLDSSRKTLHSDRDYEVAVVYEDEYGRASTALVDINNTIYMPCENSITKNTIKITLSSYPPFWAKKYKFVLKPSKDEYRTVFSNIFFPEEETGNVWFKLEGDNKSKVVLDENLKVKADTTGAVLRCVETKVLDYGSQVKDFLCARDSNGVKVDPDCTQPGGVYMQLRPSNFAAAIAPDSLINTGQETCSSGDFCAVKYSVSIKNPDSTGATDEFIKSIIIIKHLPLVKTTKVCMLL